MNAKKAKKLRRQSFVNPVHGDQTHYKSINGQPFLRKEGGKYVEDMAGGTRICLGERATYKQLKKEGKK